MAHPKIGIALGAGGAKGIAIFVGASVFPWDLSEPVSVGESAISIFPIPNGVVAANAASHLIHDRLVTLLRSSIDPSESSLIIGTPPAVA